ncbi:MAG: haloacid dehalogenase [Deltaproteobacteria bacterium]|nr:haloacid dehalogenase [Deltaproteobacteria bacterium]
MIDPSDLAFDIDGVCADTMTLFLDIARQEYNVRGIHYEDIACYNLDECLDMDADLISTIVQRLIDGRDIASLKPMEGVAEVLARVCRIRNPILFITARSNPDPIRNWIVDMLHLEPSSIEVVATGTFEGKVDVLLNRNITCFVEDRLETCFSLQEAGVTPILFKQPWNRQPHPFVEVSSWKELESLIRF